ncbi:MAG TPA: histidine kinase [Bacteroidia bacterium]
MSSPRSIAILLLLFSVQVFCQEPVFRHYSTINGLPSSETYGVMQDKNGYIWIATDRGLARFNGYEFKVYTTGQSGLKDNTIFGLYKDQNNKIWYHTYNGSIGYLYEDSFHTYEYSQLVRENFKSGRMEGISLGSNGSFMSVSQNGNLDIPIHIDKKGKTLPLKASIESRDFYFSNNNTCVVSGKTDAEITRLISQETHEVLCSFPTRSYINSPMSSFICKKKNGDLLIYCAYEIFLWNKKEIKKIHNCKERILSMMLDSSENLWLGYLNQGLEVYDTKSPDKLQSLNYQFKQLSKNSISGMTLDKEGGYWFTTLENGVYYLPPDFILSYSIESGLPVSKIRTIEKTKDKLLFVMSDHSLTFKYYNSSKIIAPKGKMWKGFNDVVYANNGVTYYATVELIDNPMIKDWKRIPVQKIHYGKYNVWGQIGADLYKYENGAFTIISFNPYGKVSSIFEIEKNEVLVGTLNGLYIYQSGKISSLKTKNLLYGQRISEIIQLSPTHFVFATIGNGILIVDKNNFSKPIHYTINNGLPSNMCNAIITESDSTVIVGTNKGICKIVHPLDPKRVKFYSADFQDGIISNEVNDLEIVDGQIWVATVNGLSIFPSKNLNKKQNTIYLRMEEIKVNGQAIHYKDQCRLPYDKNGIQFSFTGINFQHASKLRYKYRLTGSGENWNLTANRTVNYNALSPGNYTFEVMVIDVFGKEKPEKISYSFSILPPFWNTWWFILLIVILLGLLMYLLVSIRIRRVREQSLIQNDLNVLMDKALRLQMNPHFIYNSMNAIQNYIKKNEMDASIDYLNMFSRLMRTIFSNSEEQRIPLESDLEAVELYVEMENMRFSNKFKLEIKIDESLKPSLILVPPFLIQPFVENSILHGLRSKPENGNILIQIMKESGKLKIAVQDNGVGRVVSEEAGRRKQLYLGNDTRKSSGIKVTKNRIKQAWGEQYAEEYFMITDLYDSSHQSLGTLIEFYLPLN